MNIRRCVPALLVLLLALEPLSAGAQPVRFTLSYTTTYGGLKTVVPQACCAFPKIGVALAGGGARATASIGVLKVLSREGIPVSAVAGTSMGALVGGLYAAGYTPGEIEKIFLSYDWNDVFTDTPSRAFLSQEQKEAGSRHILEFRFLGGKFIPPSGLTAGQKLANLFSEKTLAASFQSDMDFDRLPVPFRAVATDLQTGEAVVLGRGLLSEALRASAAIPVVVQPVDIQGRLLVDGGLSNNLPVDVVKSLGVSRVIAVDASQKPQQRERLTSLVDIMSQSITLQVQKESQRQAALADIVITPDTSDYSFMDFPRIQEIIRRGEEAAEKALPRIRKLLDRGTPSGAAAAERFRITSLVVRGNRNVAEDAIRDRFAKLLPPRPLTRDDILGAMEALFAQGTFSDIVLDLQQEGGAYRAVLTVTGNPVVKAVEVSGNSLIPSAEVAAALRDQIGHPLNTASTTVSLNRLVERYHAQGYLLVHVEYAGMKQGAETLKVVLSEGRVDDIRISGQRRTQQSLLVREIDTDAGKPLNFDTLSRDIQRLYGLNYFETVNIDLAESPLGGVVLTFKVKEKHRGRVLLGMRYDLDDAFTGLTDLGFDNVAGRGINVFLNARYGNYTDLAMGYRTPVILRHYFVHALQVFYRQRNYLVYEDKKKVNELSVSRSGIDVSFGYQWFRFADTALRYRYAVDTTEETLGTSPAVTKARIGSWAFLASVDTRDLQPFAHRGILASFSYEAANPHYGGDVEFRKTSLFGQGFLPLGKRHTLVLEGSAGLGSGNPPYDEKFGVGGADYLISTPILGYQRREFVGLNEFGVGVAYRWKIADYQLKAVKALYLNLAGQAANVWNSRDEMSFKSADLQKGAGIGLHADTLIGPFRLDFGAGQDRRYTVYFSAGFDF